LSHKNGSLDYRPGPVNVGQKFKNMLTAVATGSEGAMASQIFRKYSHFVFWKTFFQTK